MPAPFSLRTCVGFVACLAAISVDAAIVSHPPMRALPTASNRVKADGPAKFVDAAKGNDANDGSEATPWRTLNHAAPKLQPGDTLYLRAGTYYESVAIKALGTADKPITIRTFPNELVILDGGFREFFDTPATAWEPLHSGQADEYRSTKSYPMGGGFGNFGDSLVPLHRYLTIADLRSTNEFYRDGLSDRTDDLQGIYSGPGVRRDPATGRIHVRLSHTQLPGLGENAYRGETDPRKLPLVIAGHDYTLAVEGSKHLRFQDLIFRGASRSAVLVTRDEEDINSDSEAIEFDGCTFYGSGSALRVNHTHGLKIVDCRMHGHSAPWLSRFSNKNRAYAGYLVVVEGRDFEIAHSLFTDHHDFLQCQQMNGLKFHHNLVDNFDDDGIEPGPNTGRGVTLVYQNHLSRILGTFTAHGSKPIAVDTVPGSGVYVFRNLIDLRLGTYKSPPTAADSDPTGAFLNHPSNGILTDHGSPAQPPYYVYHNTCIMPNNAFRNHYAMGWAGCMHGTTRRVFNNIFVQVDGVPGLNFATLPPTEDIETDGNLFWGLKDGPAVKDDYFAKFRSSPQFEASKRRYAPGWGAHDRLADPQFVHFVADVKQPADFRLRKSSAAIDAGIPLPTEWPDVLRDTDRGPPDLGAFPLDAEPFEVAPRGK